MKTLILLLTSINLLANPMDSLVLKTKAGEIKLKDLKGKTVLFVNIATQCGYTPQLTGLERLYKKYKSKGFTVIGIPSNEFGSQSPEDDKGIEKFCMLNHGVSFPLSKKTIVLGDKKNSVIKYLISKTNDKEIRWNFEKFLMTKKGHIARFGSAIKPESEEIVKMIEKSL